MSTLQNTRILLVGGSSGIARRIAEDALAAGAEVVLGSRRPEALADTVAELGSGASAVHFDLDDESSIAAAVTTLGPLDHVVSLAANHANGPVADLDRAAVERAFAAKVVGPILLTKHFAPTLRDGGSFVFFSGVAAWKPAPGLAVMATTNGAVAFLAEALAVELAPLRVNAVSPGIVDSGSWDGMGDGKQKMFDATAASNPARRVGRPEDVSAAVLLALTNTFVTGTTLHVDGGGRLS
ncbi:MULTISPECIES: SDR family oxidoreductase [unclassified Rhodococcus (in: high G+C Gram-positive bacteria)]|uniref:SDR family oxidoreductase n=1 Tax=unclassified Rhodococcus (in: high G+C Gram-positive bacteria) TaxID=192944 RepID=UPI0006F8B6AE|nr:MULTISPECIES: SDR family oxidoreductase [unclassified Rhodococcus (in: high G+C Gram-positive bacteria)]KQU28380.1 short-chain dehydrogenase [Rhodococcus sp. Leaf225]KQU46487.1 short-chain dehydrogenase [Rhodococcus sp. Leaf258]